MLRIFTFLVGFGFCILGLINMISYLNLMVIGYNFLEYVKFISSRLECILFIIGIILITLSLSGGKK